MQSILLEAKNANKKPSKAKVNKEKEAFRKVGKEAFRELHGYYNTESSKPLS